MSWDDFTDRMAQRNVEECAIYGSQGERWTEKCEKGCTQDEVIRVKMAIDLQDDDLRTHGVRAFGKHWGYIRHLDETTALFKGKGEDSKKSLVVSKTDNSLTFACCTEGKMSAPAVADEAMKTRDHLKTHGY